MCILRKRFLGYWFLCYSSPSIPMSQWNRNHPKSENAVRKRIESFKIKTMPAIEWLKTQDSIQFFDIKLPSDDIDINFNYICTQLNK